MHEGWMIIDNNHSNHGAVVNVVTCLLHLFYCGTNVVLDDVIFC